MGKKVERDILAALGGVAVSADVTTLQTNLTALTTAVSNISSSQEISSWSYGTMLDARGSAGTGMDRFSAGAGILGVVNEWVAPHNGRITKLSGMLGTKVTLDAIRFGVNRNGTDFYGSAAVTIGSGQSCASLATNLSIFAGDKIYMMFGGGDSLAPFNATPFSASFEATFS